MDLWKCHMADIDNLSSLSQQNAMRIRVNRVPLVQEINVDHVLQHLIDAKVLQEQEVASILHGANKHHQTRTLLQILVNKDRGSQWYKHFTHSLRSAACDSATRKRYSMLTQFLDNTVIRKDVVLPSSSSEQRGTEEMSFPRFEPLPKIESGLLSGVQRPSSPEDSSPDLNASSKLTEESGPGERYESLLEQTYQKQVEALNKVPMKAVKGQLKAEKLVYQHMRKVEFFIRNKRQRDGSHLCTLPPLSQLIRQPRLRPLAYKYIRALEKTFMIPVMTEVLASFGRFVDSRTEQTDKETRKTVAKTGTLLCDLLLDYGNVRGAEEVMNVVIRRLCLVDDIDSWQQTFAAQVKLMEARTANWFLNEADQAFHAAQMTLDKIELMSFGQDLVDKSEFMAQVGQMLLLQGSHQPGYDYATRALKHLRGHNRTRVSKVIQLAILAYYERWNGKRAERLAVFFVRYAWVHFGIFSVAYIRALLSLVRVLTRFRPSDPFTVEAAKNAVSYAELIFSCETPLLAEAYMLLSQALVAASCPDGMEYLKYAKMSLQTATTCLGEAHPHVAWFSLTLGKALLFKAEATEDKSSLQSTLAWAESEARKALEKLLRHFGDISMPSCEARVTLARIFRARGMGEEAVKVLVFVENVHRLCVSPRSHAALYFCANYARHLREDVEVLRRKEERSEEEEKTMEMANKNAMRLARRVLDNVECYGTYTGWVEQCYDIVESIFTEQGLQTNAEETRNHRQDWLTKNSLREEPLTWESLHQTPDPKFLEEWDLWGKHKSTFIKLVQQRREGKSEEASVSQEAAEDEEDVDFGFVSDDEEA